MSAPISPNDKRTPGTRVLVCGASSGIGKATAHRFAGEGWRVCLLARRQAQLEQLRAQLPGDGHLVIAGDYSAPATAAEITRTIRHAWDGLDAVVNSAGVVGPAQAVDSDIAQWRKPFDIMVNGATYLTRAVVPLMAEGGRLVHVTSIHSQRAERLASAYGMAKAAIEQYCRSLALELADKRILVNAIAPGFVRTPMSTVDGVNELETEWFHANYVQGDHLPLRRAAEPKEIAGVAYFLCGPDATYITGQVLVVDGGLTITF
ncbi:SDR family NAD(P)-dependent oxidoreductase [Phycisphaerales bacterium AB-hyl4]|uniref:SDR family NAD(P)-dependent oxidoreductase n=1 Tax=Natronomicrosphaera hydrolytica TaxID=3242702 RepID=A0ABV4U6B2_9BACT